MISLASEAEDRAQSTASLAEKLSIPLPFLHQIGHTLMQAGIIKATPGPRGGLRLNQPAETISVLDIVETLEGKVQVNPPADEGCAATNQLVWSALQERMVEYLSSISLSQLTVDCQEMPLFSMQITQPVGKTG